MEIQTVETAGEGQIRVSWLDGDVSYAPYPGGTEHARLVDEWVAAGGVIQ